VVDGVEELGKIQIYGDAVSFSDVFPYLSDRILCRASRPEPIAGLRETGIEDRHEDLCNGLLDQPDEHNGNPQRPGSPGILGYLYAPDRQGC
jgi:hypothetical protein